MQYIKNYYYQPQKSETSKVIFFLMVGGGSMKTDLTMALDTNYHLQTTKEWQTIDVRPFWLHFDHLYISYR